MRVIVATSDVPFVEGGHLTIARALVRALEENGHEAALLKTPQNRFGRQGRAYLATRFTDVSQDGLGRPIDQIISQCRGLKKPVSICGEAAARPACMALFIGMGATDLSMTPSSIPAAKQFIRNIEASFCRELLSGVKKLEDVDTVSGFLENELTKKS